MATVQLPVLPMRADSTVADAEIVYRYLQVLVQLLSDSLGSSSYLTSIPTAVDLPEGQLAFSYIAPTLRVHLNVAGSIISLELGEPA